MGYVLSVTSFDLENVGPGFPTDHLLTFTTTPTLSGYSFAETKSYYDRLNINLETMPGVTSVAFSTMPILRGYAWQNAIVGKGFEGTPIEQQPVLSQVDPNYFATLGIPVVAGRAFSTQDVAPTDYDVVNESFAREYFPGRNPIGQRFGLVDDMQTVTPKTEVIGVIPDRKYRDLRETPPPQAYFPYLAVSNVRGMTVCAHPG
jgi:hypothetical protein